MKKKDHKQGASHKKPEVVELSEDEFNCLLTRLESNELSASNHHLLLKYLRFMRWLQFSLQHTKITMSQP